MNGQTPDTLSRVEKLEEKLNQVIESLKLAREALGVLKELSDIQGARLLNIEQKLKLL